MKTPLTSSPHISVRGILWAVSILEFSISVGMDWRPWLIGLRRFSHMTPFVLGPSITDCVFPRRPYCIAAPRVALLELQRTVGPGLLRSGVVSPSIHSVCIMPHAPIGAQMRVRWPHE